MLMVMVLLMLLLTIMMMMAMAMLMVTVRTLTTIMMAMAMMMVTSYWCQGPLWSSIPLTLSLWQLRELHNLPFFYSWQLRELYIFLLLYSSVNFIIAFFSWQFGELHNLLHLRGEVPQSASSEGGRLQELPSSDPFKSTPGVAQSRGFDSFSAILRTTTLSQTKPSTHLFRLLS